MPEYHRFGEYLVPLSHDFIYYWLVKLMCNTQLIKKLMHMLKGLKCVFLSIIYKFIEELALLGNGMVSLILETPRR